MNNNRDTLHEWLREQLEIVEGEGEQLSIICLKILAGGDEKPIYEMKLGAPKWGDAPAMADILWMQATRVAKGIPGFCQFQAEAVFGTQQGTKPTRFLPFGIMGATQLGPAAGGTAFGGLATEAPTPFGQLGQGMRLTEMLVQGAFSLITHVTNVMQNELQRKDNRIDKMEHRLDEQWLALKQALLEIQNSAISNTMKALQMEAVKKLITLAPGLVNMISGRDVFPPSAVSSSLIEALSTNLTPEEQQATISLLQSRGEGGQAVAAVISDGLVRLKRQKQAEAAELDQLSTGLPKRSYDDALTDAGGGVLRVLKGEPFKPEPKSLPENGGATKKILDEAAAIDVTAKEAPVKEEKTNGHATAGEEAELLEGIKQSAGGNLDMMLGMMRSQGHAELADKLAAYYARSKT